MAVALLSCAPFGGPAGRGVSIDLQDPAIGLSDLQTYRAELRLDFEGMKDGEPLEWSQTLSLAVDRSEQARLLSVDFTDSDGAESNTAVVAGQFRQIHFTRSGAGACSGRLVEPSDTAPEIPEPARLLPPVHGASAAGTSEVFEGVDVVRYQLDELSVTFGEGADVEGSALVASEGGYLVQYMLRVVGSAGQFGEGVSGEMRWVYELQDVNRALSLAPPPGCPVETVEAPMPEDAREVVSRPGFLSFATDLVIPQAAEFYEERLPDEGWDPSTDNFVSDTFAFLTYARGGDRLTIQIRGVGKTQVWLLLESAEAGAQEPTPQAAISVENLSARISASLNKTLGIGEEPALASYHLSASGTEPAWDQEAGQVVTNSYSLEAGVAGADVHLTRTVTTPDGSTASVEGYIVAGSDYEVRSEELREASGTISLEWAAWPLNPVTALALASMGPESRGQEEVAGSAADVFDLDSARAPAASLDMLGTLGVAAARGTVWIDSATGALLKADLEFEVEFLDSGGAVLGTGAGSFRMSVSRIGGVRVELP
ncbi:MAG TPA: hypothetical protein VFI11_03805 [Anaerolineales bacterium]|nr:hypothetical protein [Anaerolineales bacterium]